MSSNIAQGSTKTPQKTILVPQGESSKRRQAGEAAESPLLSPLALMALGLTGAATVAVSREMDSSAAAQNQDSPLPDAEFAAQPDLVAVDKVATESAGAVAAQMNDLIQNLLTEKSVSGQAGGISSPASQELVNAATGAEELVGDTASAELVQMAGGGAANAEAELPLLFAQASSAAASTVATEGAVAAGTGAASTSAAAAAGGLSAGAVAAAVVAGLAVAGAASSSSSDAAPSQTSDTTAPVAPTLALTTDSGTAGDAITNVGTVNVTGLEAGASWQYSVNGGTFTAGTGTSFTVTGDGAKSVTVKQTDAAGNVSAAATALAFTLDTAAAAPVLALATDSGTLADAITNVGTVNVTGLEAGASWQYSVNGGAFTAGTGASLTVTGDGAKSVTVKQTDAAGNVSAVSTALAFTIDATAPVIQSLAAHSTTQSIDITFDSPLDSLNLPAVGAFAIATGGVDNPVASMTVIGNVLTLTLTNPFAPGAVSLTYTDPTVGDDANAAQDSAGNDAVSVIQGTVADGYVRGAQIYIDTNKDGVADASEKLAGVVTDANGNFFLPSSAPAGTIIAVGGINIDTGVANTLALKAPTGSTTINPLTTLVQAVIDAAPVGTTVTAAAAATSVATALGLTLPTGTSLTTYDPLSATGADALAAQKAAAQVATVLSLAGSAPATGTTATQAVDTVISNLATQVNTAVTSSTPIDLTAGSTVDSLFLGAVDTSGAGAQAVTDAKAAVTSISTAVDLAAVSAVQSTYLDNTAPAAPGIDLVGSSDTGMSANDNITNDTTPTLRVSLEVTKTDGTAVVAGDTVAIKNGSTQIGTAVVTADHLVQGFVDVTLGVQVDGDYTLTTVVTDKATNASAASAPLTVAIDTTLATPTAILSFDSALTSDGVTNVGTVNVTGLEAGATWQYSTNAGVSWAAGTGTSVTLTGDGAKSVTVRQTDVAGNVSAVSSAIAFTLDSSAAAPTAVLATNSGVTSDSITNDGTVNVTGLESGASWEYSTNAGTNWTAGYGASVTLSGDGAKSVTVRQMDVAGNTSEASSALAFTLDSTAAAPTATLATNSGAAGDSITNVGTVNVAGLESGATWEYSTNAGTSWSAGTGTSVTLTGDGAKSVTVRQTDVAGNTSLASGAVEFVLDGGAPTVTPSSPADGGLTLGLAANLVLSATETLVKGSGTISIFKADNSLVETIDINGSQVSITGTGANTQISINPSADLTKDAQYYVQVSSGAFTDVAGNAWAGIADATSWSFTGAGATVVVGNVAGDDTVNLVESGQPITVTGTLGAEASVLAAYTAADMTAVLNPATGAAVTLTNLSYSYTSGVTGTWSAVVPASALSGTGDYTLNVSFTGATGTAAEGIVGVGTKTVHVDTEVVTPSLGFTDSGAAGDSVTNVGTVNVTGLEAGATWQYQVDGGTFTTGTNTSIALTGDGLKSVVVRQTDAAGNASANSAALSFTLDTTLTTPTVALAVDSGTNTSDNITNDASALTLSTASEAVSRTYSVDGGTASAGYGAPTADGSHTVVVTDTDTAGNSASSTILTFTLDTTLTAPTVALAVDSGTNTTDKLTNDAGALTLSTASETVSRTYSVDGGTASASYVAPTVDGSHTVVVTDTDTAGNSASSTTLTFMLDKTVATPTVALAVDSGTNTTDKVTNDVSTLTLSTASETVTRTYSVDGGTASASYVAPTVDGSHTVVVTDTDTAGNSASSTTLTFMLDKTVATPTVALAVDSGTNAADTVTNDASTLTLGTASETVTRTYSVDGGTANASYVAPTADGSHTVVVTDTDIAGNSASSTTLTFTLDKTVLVPTVALTSDTGTSNSDKITSSGAVTVAGTESGALVEYSTNSGSTWTTSFTAVAGSNTVQVRQTDVAGNVSAASTALTFTLDTAAPTVVINEPNTAPNATTGALTFGFTFSEAVTGFDATDVTVGNGTKGSVVKIDDSHYSLEVTPTSSNTPLNLTVAVPATGATDIAGNTSAAANQFLASILYGTAGNDTLTVGPSLDHIFLGAGADVLKLTSAADSTAALPDDVLDFGQGDMIDLSALLSTGGSGYTGSALGDSGAGFVELKNVTLVQNTTNSTTLVKFDVHFDAASVGGSGVSGAVIDLVYNYSAVSVAQAVSPTFVDQVFGSTTNVWSNVVGNLSGATANGKIALTADLTAGNPIIDANGKALAVTLVVNGLVNSFDVGLEAVANGGTTAITTADNVTHNVDVGITKTAGVTIGATGTLEIITDTGTLGTVGDNQLHMVSTYDTQNNTTHLQVQYDTNSAFGTGNTTLSSVIALDFDGDVTANLTPAHLTFI